jgi:3',5'-cyclic-AMP phosphodiesterase
MVKIIHVTDIHIVPEGELVVGMDPSKRLSEVICSINETYSDADLCIISGDLADRGDLASYRRLAHHLETLLVPYRLMLGNHDNRAAFRQVFPNVRVCASGWVQSVEDFGGIRFIFLDTLDNNRPDTGVLCHERLSWLAERLRESAGRRVFIFMHHPPHSVGVKWFDNMMLEQPEGFRDLVRQHPCIEHIAFGHLHLTTTGRWDRLSFSCNRGTCHRIALSLDSEMLEFVDSDPAYDVHLITDSGIVVHHTTPTSPDRLIAREYTTPDGKGRIEYVGDWF